MAMNWIETLRTEEPDALTRVRYMFNPLRLKMSPQFHAIVACLLGVQEVWTQPEFAHMYITSDNFLLGMRVGDCGANDFIGSSDDLIANLKGLVELHELTDDEKRAFVESANNHISNSSATFDLAKALNVSFEEVEVTVSHCRLHVWKGTTVRDLIVNHPDLCEGVEYKETDEKDSDGYPVKEVVPIDIDGAIERGDLIIH